ncbi:MAG: heme ABC exporter ATP-binding protein CcmA [Rhizobiaceae bacterium]|nr:heme ABC exporter ATP-binding protein CcmA [Rhizobiaceae bacterium]
MRLVAENLAGERGGEPVFSAIGFALASGQGLTVTGANGAGKSTLLRVLAGLLPATAGTIRLEGGGDEWPTARAACHYLGHQNGMKTALTVKENLGFWRDFNGPGRKTVDEALAAVGLAGLGHLPFGYLSTGQRRRAAIARLLVSHRPLWLLDEPTSGLDAASEGRLARVMVAHLADGGMIVAATHQPLGLAGQELRMGGK